MSCFMCSDDHIIVVAFATTFGLGDKAIRDARFALFVEKDFGAMVSFEAAVRNLFIANWRSVEDRYPSKSEPRKSDGELFKMAPPITNRALERISSHVANPMTVIKLCRSYEYQSCEWRGWEESEERKMVAAAIRSCVSLLPGWSEAPWSI